MDMYMREAIMKYLETQEINDTVLATAEKKKSFLRLYVALILKDNELLCKGKSGVEQKVNPTPQQVWTTVSLGVTWGIWIDTERTDKPLWRQYLMHDMCIRLSW